MKEPRVVSLVSCSGPKLPHAAPAAELYGTPPRSDLFRKSVAYAKSLGPCWAILSAKHGLVMPDQVLAPYDLALSELSAEERRRWGRMVLAQIRETYPKGTHFVVLAGKHYVKPFGDLEDYSFEDPLKGMGFERKRWLVENTGA